LIVPSEIITNDNLNEFVCPLCDNVPAIDNCGVCKTCLSNNISMIYCKNVKFKLEIVNLLK